MKKVLDHKKLKQNPFSVPEDYFGTLQARVLAKNGISTEIQEPRPRRVRLISPIWISVAAAVLVTLVLGTLLFSELKTSRLNESYYSLLEGTIDQYSENTLLSFVATNSETNDSESIWIDDIDENLLIEINSEPK